MRRAAALALLALALAMAATAAPTLAAAPRTTLSAIEPQVMCVVCKTPLSIANGLQADAERDYIRGLIAKGMSEQQVKDALVAQYGERVLALPPDDGFNLAVYLVPALGLLAGLLGLALALPRWRRRTRLATTAAALQPELSEQDARRLDDDLARYDS